jgi:hypothetical protein
MSVEKWKRVVYEAVETSEGEARGHRFDAMGENAQRYRRIKRWEPVPQNFAEFKGEIGVRGALVSEAYLDDHDEPVGRQLKLMCRTGCLPTLSRVGRKAGWPAGSMRCMMCHEGAEDICHIMLDCAAYGRHRDAMMRCVREPVALAMGPDALDQMASVDKLDMLLGKSTGNAAADKYIDRVVKRFLKKAWRGRKQLTRALNQVLGREDTMWALNAHGDT